MVQQTSDRMWRKTEGRNWNFYRTCGVILLHVQKINHKYVGRFWQVGYLSQTVRT